MFASSKRTFNFKLLFLVDSYRAGGISSKKSMMWELNIEKIMVVSKRGIKIDWAQPKQHGSDGFSREMYYRGGPLSSSLSAPIHYIYLYALSAVELLFIACSLSLHTHSQHSL
jgi:hypothetical protein